MYILTHIPAPFEVHGTCISFDYATWNAALSLSSDVAIWALPVVAVWKLQTTVQRKVELCILLSLGLVACACGLVKAIVAAQALKARDVSCQCNEPSFQTRAITLTLYI